MDHKMIANITLEKMIRAQERGCRTVLVVDDLNFYVARQGVERLQKAGGVVIKNNPFTLAWRHISNGEYQKFFNRNHQKVMLVDSHVFCGSLNVADPYSGVRYGDSSFRDLNILVRDQEAKDVRSFFMEILSQNEEQLPEPMQGQALLKVFSDLDEKFAAKHASTQESNVDFKFLEERPPSKTEVTDHILHLVRSAQSSIRIIQPYVQNIEEVEHELFEAMEKRGVSVEIITARKRDQPIYQSFLNADLFSELMKRGAKIYEEPYKYLHMKAVDIDDGRYLTIGSLNQDHCSYYQNNEANVLLSKKESNGQVAPEYNQFRKIYNNLLSECRRVHPDESYSYGGYIENKLWRLSLFATRWVCLNREVGVPRKSE